MLNSIARARITDSVQTSERGINGVPSPLALLLKPVLGLMLEMRSGTSRITKPFPRVQVARGALWLILGLVVFTITLGHGSSLWKTGQHGASKSGSSQRQELDDALFRQGLSHNVFHHNLAKKALAALVKKYNRIAVVGVEGGKDVVQFAMIGYKVHAFEPMQEYFEYFQNISRTPWFSEYAPNVEWHKVAATDVHGQPMQARYVIEGTNKLENATTARVDHVLDVPIDVLSADIQGDELDVVRGADKLLRMEDGVRSLWVEIHACNPKATKLLHLLRDRGYILFDMVPHGGRKDKGGYMGLHDFSDAASLGWRSRPSCIDEYATWFCALKESHKWVQADVLAIRKDLVTEHVMLQLSTLSHSIFQKLTCELEGKERPQFCDHMVFS